MSRLNLTSFLFYDIINIYEKVGGKCLRQKEKEMERLSKY